MAHGWQDVTSSVDRRGADGVGVQPGAGEGDGDDLGMGHGRPGGEDQVDAGRQQAAVLPVEERRRERAARRALDVGPGQVEDSPMRAWSLAKRPIDVSSGASSSPATAGKRAVTGRRLTVRRSPHAYVSTCRHSSCLTKRTGRATLAAMAVPAAVPSAAPARRPPSRSRPPGGTAGGVGGRRDTGDGGCCRLALTDEDRRGPRPGRRLDARTSVSSVSVDAIGNVVGLLGRGRRRAR